MQIKLSGKYAHRQQPHNQDLKQNLPFSILPSQSVSSPAFTLLTLSTQEAFNLPATPASLNMCLPPLYHQSYLGLKRVHLTGFILNFQVPNTSLYEKIR